MSDLSQVCLAIYDTNAQPFTYTGSEHIDMTNNQVSLTGVCIKTETDTVFGNIY